MKTVSAYIEQEPAELVVLDIYPGTEPSTYTLYEDDGQTYAYENGSCATTAISCQPSGDSVHVAISARQGSYDGMPAARTYLVCTHTASKPLAVHANRVMLTECAGSDALQRQPAAGWCYLAERNLLIVKPNAGWRLGADQRGQNDPEQDTLVWSTAERPSAGACEIDIQMPPAAEGKATRAATAPRPYPLSPEPQTAGTGVPDRLRVAANPPERIALKWGDWLEHRTNLYVSICAGEQIASHATNIVRMEIVDAGGATLRTEEKQAQHGRVEFLNTEYKPAEWTFRFSSAGLEPCEVTIRPAPEVPGQMFGPPAA